MHLAYRSLELETGWRAKEKNNKLTPYSAFFSELMKLGLISYSLKSLLLCVFAQHIKTLHEIVANEALQDGRILLANFSAGHSCIPFQTSGSASLRIQIQPSRRHKGRRFAEESDLRNRDRPLCSQAKAVKKEFVLTD